MQGAAWGLVFQSSQPAFECAGFTWVALARTLWNGNPPGNGNASTDRTQSTQIRQNVTMSSIFEAHFAQAAPIVATICQEFEDCYQSIWNNSLLVKPEGEYPLAIHQILGEESNRDRLDQHISELAKFPPGEAILELIRCLSTLVGLYDFEESMDPHESRAIIRTIWENNQIASSPAWLQTSSPFIQRLGIFLK
jgi:hypothetical protein